MGDVELINKTHSPSLQIGYGRDVISSIMKNMAIGTIAETIISRVASIQGKLMHEI